MTIDQSAQDTVVPLPASARPTPLESVQGTLALELQPRHAPPPLPTVALRAVREEEQPVPPVRRALEQWCHRFTQAAVEIVGGDRPASQLARWTSAPVYEDLQRRALLVARAGGHDPGQARVQPVRPKVVGVHAFFPTPHTAEVSVRVRYGPRFRAVAARFELHRNRYDARPRWICTALEFA